MDTTDSPDERGTDPAAPHAGAPDDTVRLTKEPTDSGDTPPPLGPPPGPPPGAEPGAEPPPPGPPPPGPAGTSGFRSLYRTRDPKIIAGVCGGLARATNTDPILFRVILAVLFFFGGLGLAIYLLAWLLLPLEGETASPAEALLGRGQSSTGPVLTIVIAVVAFLALRETIGNFGNLALGAAVVAGVALLLQRAGAIPPLTWLGQRAAAGAPTPAYATATAGATAPPPPAPGYTPPFAPHGPWGGRPYGRRWHSQQDRGAPVPPRVKPPRERSILGRLTLSTICLALAALGAVDLAGASIPAMAYWATALGVTAAGLLLGAWFGRARALIVLGIVLVLGTSATGAAHRVTHDQAFDRTVRWAPTTAADVKTSYDADTGQATLDLSAVDFASKDTTTNVHLGAGRLRIKVPTNVDLTVHASLGVGSADILGEPSDGFGIDRGVTNPGPDGTGGGTLTLNIQQGAGRLEVTR